MTPEPTPGELKQMEISENKKKYGYSTTTNELISGLINVACEMGKELNTNGMLDNIPFSRDWYIHHKKFDENRQSEERTREMMKLNSEKIDLIRNLKRSLIDFIG
jgi:hypothetical protein